jgi:xanthine dehydrogenase accessory factor
MHEILLKLFATLESGRAAALCRLVETRGSTPQKPGAAMLVLPDGSQAGTLGGGCVEAEVKRRALAILNAGDAAVVKFQLDSDYGWDDGLICGGRMQVLIEPLRRPDDAAYYRAVATQAEQARGFVEAIVFDAAASGQAAPANYLFDAHGTLIAAAHQASARAPDAIVAGLPDLGERPRPQASQGVAYLPALPRCRLIVVGGGHVGQAVASWAADLDFDVWVVDDRPEYVTAERFPRAARRICGDVNQVLPAVEIDGDTYCLIVTRGHNHDEEALYHLVDRGARYVGMIGSKRKIRLIFEDLMEQGISAEALSRVYAPVGIDIGSQTVPEIAVSILAELVAHRNRAGDVPGRPDAISIVEPAG